MTTDAVTSEAMTSVEVGSMMHERDVKHATHLFRTQSMGKNSVDLEPNTCLGSFEPDWSKFENVFASGKLYVFYLNCVIGHVH